MALSDDAACKKGDVRLYVVMYRANLGLSHPPSYQNTDKVVLHILNGKVDKMVVFDFFVASNTHLFELEGATRIFSQLTIAEAVRLGAHVLHFRVGKTYNPDVLGIGLYERREGKPRAAVSPINYDLAHTYPGTRLVVSSEVCWDSFSEQTIPANNYHSEMLVMDRVEFKAVLGDAVDTLALAIRTYQG